jgi:hypothetical protein
MEATMRGTRVFVAVVVLVLSLPSTSAAKDKKKHSHRGMLESMQSVPCGVNERGLTGVGSIFGSIGIQHVNSNEKLCPQYLFRTDELDYHIRPMDMKHAVLLPVGQEGEFKIKKNRLMLKMVDEDKKMRAYQVVSVEPVKSQGDVENTSYHSADRPAPRATEVRPPERNADRLANQRSNSPPPPQ